MSEGRMLYCHNKKCEAFNQAQGDWGAEDKKNVKCIICGRVLKKNKLEGEELI